jgi:hypothetical protein
MKIINNISSATLRIIYSNRNNQICRFFDFYFLITGLPDYWWDARFARLVNTRFLFVVRKRGFPPFRLFHTRPPVFRFDGITGSLSRLSRALLPFFAERGWYHWKVSVS